MVERKNYRPIDEVVSELRMTKLQFKAVRRGEGEEGYNLAGNARDFEGKVFRFGDSDPKPFFELNQSIQMFEVSLDKLFFLDQGTLQYILKDSDGKVVFEPLVTLIDSMLQEVGNSSLDTSMYIISDNLKKLEQRTSSTDREPLVANIKRLVDKMGPEITKLSRFLNIYSLLRELVLQSTNIVDSDQFEDTDESEWRESQKPINKQLFRMNEVETRGQITVDKARKFLEDEALRKIIAGE